MSLENNPAVRTLTINGQGATRTGTPNRATLTLFPDAPVSLSVLQVPKGESLIFAVMDHNDALWTCAISLSRLTPGTQAAVEPGEYELQRTGGPENLAALRAIPGLGFRDNPGSDFGTVILTAEAIAHLGPPVDATRQA